MPVRIVGCADSNTVVYTIGEGPAAIFAGRVLYRRNDASCVALSLAERHVPTASGQRGVRLAVSQRFPQRRIHELNQRCFDLLLLFLRETAHVARVTRSSDVSGPAPSSRTRTSRASIWLLRKALGDDAKALDQHWSRSMATSSTRPVVSNQHPRTIRSARTRTAAIEPMPQEDVRELRLAPRSRPAWRYGSPAPH